MPQCSAARFGANGGGLCPGGSLATRRRRETNANAGCSGQPPCAQAPSRPPITMRATRTCPPDPCASPADCFEPITVCPTMISPNQVCREKKRGGLRNFRRSAGLKPRPDLRIYRNGEHLCISYAGHIPGEQFIHGRNLPTTTTFAKRRLKTYTPYEFVDPDGCCSFP